MNITLLCNRDLASNYALNLLLPQLLQHRLTLFLSAKVGGNQNAPEPLQQLRFFEQSLPNQLLFPALGSTPCQGRLRSFDLMAEWLTTPASELNDINTDAGLARLRASQPDLIISIRFGVILKEAAIAVPKLGVINLHSGLLPQYRGVMATFWAMLHGESAIGTTLHYIADPTIDTGAIIGTTHQPVDYNRSYLWNVLQLYPQGTQLIASTVAALAEGDTPTSKPPNGTGNYFSFPDKAHLDLFCRRNLKLVDLQDYLEHAAGYLDNESI